MQLYLNFSLIMVEALYRYRASSWEQTPLLEPSTRRWYRTPRRWTCPTLSQQQPSGCVTWCMNAFVYVETKKEFYSCCWSKGQKIVVLRTRLANLTTGVTDTEPSEQWSSGESRLHSTWTCWNISGSDQRQNPVFCSGNTVTNASVDDQTRSMDSHEIQCEKGHTNDCVREDSWTEIQKRDSSIGGTSPRSPSWSELQPWVTGVWLGHDTLSDEHLIGTAAGVMRSRAVRRIQETARWVPAALNAMLFTPWSPHLNLPARPRLQRPTYEEPTEAGTLPRFIEIPTAPTKNPKSETAMSTPDDTGQSTKRRRQEVTFQEPLPTSSAVCAAAGTATDSSMVILGPQIPKPARPLSPAEERTVSKNVRDHQR